MAAYDLEEQEQLEELKTWWKMYGNLITAVVVVLAVAVVGWQGWNWWQRGQAGQAAAAYGALQQAVADKNAKRAREIAGELVDKYGSTAYAAMGAMLSAKAQIEAGDAKTARAELAWAADNAKDEALRDLARLRLAGALFDDNAPDEALKQLAAEPSAPFAARFAEMRGDILAAQGKTAEARSAYQTALTKSEADKATDPKVGDPHRGYREILKAKLDSLGPAAK